MKIQRIFILTLITFLFINLFFINIQNTNALSFNFGGENSNLEESYSSQTGSNSWLDNFFSNVGKASKNIFQSTFSSVSDVVGKYYFGIEPAKIEVVNISDNIKIDGEDVGNVKIENLEDLNNDEDYSKVGLDQDGHDHGGLAEAEKEIENKIIQLEKDINKTKSDINKNPDEKIAELAKLNQDLKKEQTALTNLQQQKVQIEQIEGKNYAQRYQDYQNNPPAPVPQSVLNQSNISPNHAPYDGRFACNNIGNGMWRASDRPVNQGGKTANELFYSIANAAKESGANIGSMGCYVYRNIAGSGNLSAHSSGEACDIVADKDQGKMKNFMILFLANTGNYNSVGTYASMNFNHSHLGKANLSDNVKWTHYRKGPGIEPWKKFAFEEVFAACGKVYSEGVFATKIEVQRCAKIAAERICGKDGGTKSLEAPTS